MNNKIKVGPVTYDVKFLPAQVKDKYGLCMYNKKIIYLNRNMHHSTASDTLLHEVLHAIWHEASIEQAPIVEQEFIVNTTSTWLTMVLKDNPWLAKFILNSKPFWNHKKETMEEEEEDDKTIKKTFQEKR
jgi:hypothetical protein